MPRFESGGRGSMGMLKELGLRSLGMGDAMVGMAWETVQSVNDGLWTVANTFSSGHLAENVSVAREAVARNNARGAAMLSAGEQLAGAGLRLATGNMSPADAIEATGQGLRQYLQIDRGLALEAAGDYRGAQTIWGRGALELAGSAAVAAGIAGKVGALGSGVTRAVGVGLRISAEDFGASSIGQRVAGAVDSYMGRVGLRLNVSPDQASASFWATRDVIGSDIFADTAPLKLGRGDSAHSSYQYELLKRDLLRQEITSPGDPMSGPVVLRRPVAGATAGQEQQIRQYADVSSLAIAEGYMSPTGRISTKGQLRAAANYAARAERLEANIAGRPYVGVVGHGPDTTWTGRPVSPFWLDMDGPINASLGRQAQDYPLGFKPTHFVYERDINWTGNGNW